MNSDAWSQSSQTFETLFLQKKLLRRCVFLGAIQETEEHSSKKKRKERNRGADSRVAEKEQLDAKARGTYASS